MQELDIYSYTHIYILYIYRERFSISIGNTENHVATLTCLEWHTVKIKHSHYRLIDNEGDYLYLKNQRMGASNFELVFISSTWDCTTFHNFLPMFKKKIQKLAGLWLAGEVVNHVGIYGSKAAEGLSAFQRRSCSGIRLWKYPFTVEINLKTRQQLALMAIPCCRHKSIRTSL